MHGWYGAVIGYAGATTGVYAALALLVARHKNPVRLFGGGLFLAFAYTLFLLTVFIEGSLQRVPHLMFTQLPVTAALGPLLYGFIRAASDADFRSKWGHSLHFLPAIVLTIFFAPFYFLPGEMKIRMLQDQVVLAVHFPLPILRALFALAYASPIPYLLLGGFRCRVFLTAGDFPFFRTMAVCLGFCAAVILLMLLALVFPRAPELKLAALTLFSLAMLIAFIGLMRSPRFPELLRRDARAYKRQKSRLAASAADAKLPSIQNLFEIEKIYRDENLKIAEVALRLAMRPDQVSQLVNDAFGVNFNRFVNRYRVREAQKLLRENREFNILEIALQCGFNTKSSFNTAFKLETRLSPREFRSKIRSES